MNSKFQKFFSASLFVFLTTTLISSCSSNSSKADCEQVTSFKNSLTNKADIYWEEDHPKNGGTGDYSRSKALIIEADQLVIDNPSCFSREDISFAKGRLEENIPNSTISNSNNFSTSSIFDQPAQSYMLTSGINSLMVVWGIPLNHQNGPRTLGEVSDDILIYLNSNAGGAGDLTKNDLLTSLQPGNALNSMVHRLFKSEDVIDAVVNRWLSYLS